jgi:hypothetical protein
LAGGSLSRVGTATVVGLSTNANLGTLREVAGAANNLAIQTQPSATATVGVPFVQQPVIQVLDRFGNLRNAANGTADNSTLVSAARAAGSGTLQGTVNLTAMNGVVAYTNLSFNVATNITVSFSSSGLVGVTSSVIAVSQAPMPQLVAMQPTDASPGSVSGSQSGFQTLTATAPVMTGVLRVPGGMKVSFMGNKDQTYQVERTAALRSSATVWETIGSAMADNAGQGEFTDSAPLPGQGFYRVLAQ